ncbi:ATP-binding cassette domain-containing protein [Pseudonocardia eucalypti]|uniref:ATP-binding cassette domain-containing protein n=1 Tax=Pseudonocardia eucalypti TaxID=648755 RepID=A0ABP9PGN2_9PSEU|nr:iron complex transport system ATP-binding protein [Pseudonocardia eucalypti]
MPRESEPVLDIVDVDFVREGRDILACIRLTVHAGEHWALLGPNGAGKSTLLSLCGAIAHPTRGAVQVLGFRLGRVDMRELRGWIGHVDPRQPLDPRLSVEQAVLTGVTGSNGWVPRWKPSATALRRADDLMELLGVARLRDAGLATLSQGERGRTLVARALMPQPHLLLLDEPSTGLDLAARERLLTSVDTLRAEYPSLASVLVTHHLEELPASTTHAMLLRGGRTLSSGPVADVLTSSLVSTCFDHPVLIKHSLNRWTAQAAPIPETDLPTYTPDTPTDDPHPNPLHR